MLLARKISTQAMSVYSLTLPTLSLLLNIAQLGIPTTISKLIAKKKFPTFKIMQVSIFIMLVIDLFIGIFYILLVPNIATYYLQNTLTIKTLYGMVLLIPLISFTSLLKGYFIGINKTEKTTICQISEEITRLLFIIIFVDFINKEDTSTLSFFAMFSSIIGEIASLIHLLISIKYKGENISKRITTNNKNNKQIFNKIMSFSIMNTSTRLVGSLIYFLEPIIYTSIMLKNNIPSIQLTLEYGIVNSYFIPLIILPSFFSNGLSMYMLPNLSTQVENNNYNYVKKHLCTILFFSFLIGFFFILFIYNFPEFILNLIYGKIIGVEYIKKYSLFFIVYFLQAPLHISMICLDKEKVLLYESIICNIVKVISFYIFIPAFEIDGLIISLLISTYLSIFIEVYHLFKSVVSIKNKHQFSFDENT